MIAVGIPLADAALITPASPDTLAVIPGVSTPQVIVTPGSVAQTSADSAAPLPATPTPNAAVSSTGPYLTNMTATEQIAADNCAAAPSASFAQSTSGIYAVATAFNLTPQHVITYRWLRDGTEVWVDTWSPAADTNGECIWYYVTPVEIEFLPGAWSVEVLIDGTSSPPGIAFTVTA
jgi:hypothetical protein